MEISFVIDIHRYLYGVIYKLKREATDTVKQIWDVLTEKKVLDLQNIGREFFDL